MNIDNVKSIVGVALVVSAFVLGNIVLLGVATGSLALVLHFAYTLVICAIGLYAIRGLLARRSLIMGSVLVLLVALSTMQLASGFHAYEHALSGLPSASNAQQLSSIKAQNAYYANTISSLSGAINTSQAQVRTLRAQIDTVIMQEYGQQYAQPAAQPVAQQNPASRTEREERHERGETDD